MAKDGFDGGCWVWVVILWGMEFDHTTSHNACCVWYPITTFRKVISETFRHLHDFTAQVIGICKNATTDALVLDLRLASWTFFSRLRKSYNTAPLCGSESHSWQDALRYFAVLVRSISVSAATRLATDELCFARTSVHSSKGTRNIYIYTHRWQLFVRA